jgi:hypothetical protein
MREPISSAPAAASALATLLPAAAGMTASWAAFCAATMPAAAVVQATRARAPSQVIALAGKHDLAMAIDPESAAGGQHDD